MTKYRMPIEDDGFKLLQSKSLVCSRTGGRLAKILIREINFLDGNTCKAVYDIDFLKTGIAAGYIGSECAAGNETDPIIPASNGL